MPLLWFVRPHTSSNMDISNLNDSDMLRSEAVLASCDIQKSSTDFASSM